MATPKIAAEFIGEGTEHLGGIPASDLTEEQVDALPEERRTELLANAADKDHAIYKLHTRDLKAEAKEVAAGQLDPNDSTPPGPGEITDQAGYAAAVASGAITPIAPDDPDATAEIDASTSKRTKRITDTKGGE